jgi:hypothetical protein
MGHDTLSSILARRGQRLEVMRDKRDTEINDLFKRCVTISKSNPEMELTPIQVLEVYEQRSPNPSIMMAPVTDEADDKETSSTATDDTDAKPKQKHGKGKGK